MQEIGKNEIKTEFSVLIVDNNPDRRCERAGDTDKKKYR